MHQLPSDLSSYVNVIVQLALCIATLYAFVALIRATQTEGEPCTFYLLLGAHLLEPLVSVVWGYTIGAFLWILAWMTFPIFGPVFVTLPMLLLLVPLSIDWHNNKLHKWAWWLAMLGLAR